MNPKNATSTHRARSKHGGLRTKLAAISTEFVTNVLNAARLVAIAPREEEPQDAERVTHRIRRLRALQRAVEWQLQLENGNVGSKKDIAEREGISQAAVTQAMRVLQVFANDQGDLLPTHVFRTRRNAGSSKVGPFRKLRKELLQRFETDYVTATLRAASGNISMAARLAQIDRKHFWRLVRRTRVEKHTARSSPR